MSEFAVSLKSTCGERNLNCLQEIEMNHLRKLLFALLACTLSLGAHSDIFPSRPITIIVAYTASGANDIVARAVANKMSENLGKPVIVDNKPGAGGSIGAVHVARSSPDGYTLLLGNASMLTMNPWLTKDLPYSVTRDFEPITEAGFTTNMLIVNNELPVSTVKDLIEYAKANPGKLSFASPGVGTSVHLSGEIFKAMTGVDMVHVPYKGSSPVLSDLLAGRVQLMFDNLPTALPLVQGGRVKVLAVTSKSRSSLAPGVPTLDELGLRGFDVSGWLGFFAPKGTPQPIVERLHAEIVKTLKDPAVVGSLGKLGITTVANSPNEFAAEISSDLKRWHDVIEKTGLKLN